MSYNASLSLRTAVIAVLLLLYNAKYTHPSFSASGLCVRVNKQGLYPESHGIINNNFYDTELKQKFSESRDEFDPNETDSKWWKGEPVGQT